jgi:hypothetical protein
VYVDSDSHVGLNLLAPTASFAKQTVGADSDIHPAVTRIVNNKLLTKIKLKVFFTVQILSLPKITRILLCVKL